MRGCLALVLLHFLLLAPGPVRASGSITVELPPSVHVASAVAASTDVKSESARIVKGSTVVFDALKPQTIYDVKLTLADGMTIQGVNLDWYNDDDARPDAGPLSDDDRGEMMKIVRLDPFMNHQDFLLLSGNHDRATVLVQLARDKDFYAGAGQVIWRVELFYFKNQHGGWEKIPQVNKIIRRERFKTREAHQAALAKIKFVAALGGLKLDKDQEHKTIKVESFDAPAMKGE